MSYFDVERSFTDLYLYKTEDGQVEHSVSSERSTTYLNDKTSTEAQAMPPSTLIINLKGFSTVFTVGASDLCPACKIIPG